MDKNQNELIKDAEKKIQFGIELIDQLKNLAHVDGVSKIQRKIRQEIAFLKKLQLTQSIKKEQLISSNLRHLAAIVESASRPGVISVSKVLHSNEGNKVSIDIVSDNGNIWTKVIARNPKSLSALSDGNSSYGTRSVLDQAQDYLNCSIQHPNLYQPPKVIFEFVSGIESGLASKLQELGVIVQGTLIPSSNDFNVESDSDYSNSDDDNDVSIRNPWEIDLLKSNDTEVDTLNLDVTTMMAYISNLTNGHYNFVYEQPLLSQQAVWEAKRHIKPELENLFKGKKLVCCQTAWDDFSKIVNILGGPNEKMRADKLKEKITIMSNDENGPDEIKRAELKVKGRIRLRSKIVFNFGQRIRALTVSANEGFIRSAKQQGVTYAAIIHESRALTEMKERTAKSVILPVS